ncbi:MAG: malic enzyme-like NAD(P)-binding protein [Clostridium sp.]|uniref:NAD(P)-dependent malic enzyme n=1 Tax=Clostridium sp. TaxID=1506 RepID=UPI002FCA1065
MSIYDEALKFHEESRGKLEVVPRVSIETAEDLSLAYTPGVAQPCLEIERDPSLAYKYTRKWNTIAVISDGTAVLGLGDIGPLASLPVMEGKSILFKKFGDVDAIPILLDTKTVSEIVDAIVKIAPTFGGINLEDISAPRCFEIEKKLKEKLNIPVFHDDQHGTAIVTLAAVINSMKITGKNLSDMKIIVNGAGAAGVSITKLLLSSGAKNIILCDRSGAISKERTLTGYKKDIAAITNPNNESGDLKTVMVGADIFVGVSAPNTVTPDMVRLMNRDPIIFAMANPVPEIFPEDAKKAGARIIGTGRSDFPNQINNVLAFPGIFRGALDAVASDINEEMKVAAAVAIAESVADHELREDYIIPKAFDLSVQKRVAEYVYKAAIESGVSRL